MLYVAALGNVDNSIIEAAQVDGATKFQVFWKIKWPSIMPTTLYVLVITTINSFQCFALIQLLTKGGPLNSTMTIMYQVYDHRVPAERPGLCQRHRRGSGHHHRHFLRASSSKWRRLTNEGEGENHEITSTLI